MTNRNDILMSEHTMESIGQTTCCPTYNCLHRAEYMFLYKLTVITIVNIHTPAPHKVIALTSTKQSSKSSSKELRDVKLFYWSHPTDLIHHNHSSSIVVYINLSK